MSLFGAATKENKKTLIRIRAGKMVFKNKVVYPVKKRGWFYLYENEDKIVHLCWKDRETGVTDYDLMLLPGDAELSIIKYMNSSRIFVIKCRKLSIMLFFWMQEPDETLDGKRYEEINNIVNYKYEKITERLENEASLLWSNGRAGTTIGSLLRAMRGFRVGRVRNRRKFINNKKLISLMKSKAFEQLQNNAKEGAKGKEKKVPAVQTDKGKEKQKVIILSEVKSLEPKSARYFPKAEEKQPRKMNKEDMQLLTEAMEPLAKKRIFEKQLEKAPKEAEDKPTKRIIDLPNFSLNHNCPIKSLQSRKNAIDKVVDEWLKFRKELSKAQQKKVDDCAITLRALQNQLDDVIGMSNRMLETDKSKMEVSQETDEGDKDKTNLTDEDVTDPWPPILINIELVANEVDNIQDSLIEFKDKKTLEDENIPWEFHSIDSFAHLLDTQLPTLLPIQKQFLIGKEQLIDNGTFAPLSKNWLRASSFLPKRSSNGDLKKHSGFEENGKPKTFQALKKYLAKKAEKNAPKTAVSWSPKWNVSKKSTVRELVEKRKNWAISKNKQEDVAKPMDSHIRKEETKISEEKVKLRSKGKESKQKTKEKKGKKESESREKTPPLSNLPMPTRRSDEKTKELSGQRALKQNEKLVLSKAFDALLFSPPKNNKANDHPQDNVTKEKKPVGKKLNCTLERQLKIVTDKNGMQKCIFLKKKKNNNRMIKLIDMREREKIRTKSSKMSKTRKLSKEERKFLDKGVKKSERKKTEQLANESSKVNTRELLNSLQNYLYKRNEPKSPKPKSTVSVKNIEKLVKCQRMPSSFETAKRKHVTSTGGKEVLLKEEKAKVKLTNKEKVEMKKNNERLMAKIIDVARKIGKERSTNSLKLPKAQMRPPGVKLFFPTAPVNASKENDAKKSNENAESVVKSEKTETMKNKDQEQQETCQSERQEPIAKNPSDSPDEEDEELFGMEEEDDLEQPWSRMRGWFNVDTFEKTSREVIRFTNRLLQDVYKGEGQLTHYGTPPGSSKQADDWLQESMQEKIPLIMFKRKLDKTKTTIGSKPNTSRQQRKNNEHKIEKRNASTAQLNGTKEAEKKKSGMKETIKKQHLDEKDGCDDTKH